MRYVFGAPTIWAVEIARMVQIWASFLAAGFILAQRRMIRVSVVTDRLPPRANAGPKDFPIVDCWFLPGGGLVRRRGGNRIDRHWQGQFDHARASPMATEFAIPVGFGLLLTQALILFITLVRPRRSGRAESLSGLFVVPWRFSRCFWQGCPSRLRLVVWVSSCYGRLGFHWSSCPKRCTVP